MSLESLEIRQQWLRELAEFIIEANKNTWAADGTEVKPERLGYKELEYENDLWRLRDSYTGYFRAPGMTTVYHKDRPVWTMAYGGHGQTEGYEDKARQTFQFLRAALMRVTPELPFRGPERYKEGGNLYTFKMLDGDIVDGLWKEEITENGVLIFTQIGVVGIVIHRDSNRNPISPWNL
ncbi:hypothetical protein HY385_02895 [Candidatus Daviesbacteria bacterium]|nr:hypothetical protein [Candidatus Daviesbacteria bacterium]